MMEVWQQWGVDKSWKVSRVWETNSESNLCALSCATRHYLSFPEFYHKSSSSSAAAVICTMSYSSCLFSTFRINLYLNSDILSESRALEKYSSNIIYHTYSSSYFCFLSKCTIWNLHCTAVPQGRNISIFKFCCKESKHKCEMLLVKLKRNKGHWAMFKYRVPTIHPEPVTRII